MDVGSDTDMDVIPLGKEWDFGGREYKMHRVHPYPAKFPAFIATKAFEYAKTEGVTVHRVADIFCGCGTVALEARMCGIDFWGCDINPVATLIAKAKSNKYNAERLQLLYDVITADVDMVDTSGVDYNSANERIRYWFNEENFLELYKIKVSIETRLRSKKNGKYRAAFLCIFSSILKASSRWLAKSIKPQVDPFKESKSPTDLFERHFGFFLQAVKELDQEEGQEKVTKVNVKNRNFLEMKGRLPKVDLVVTSPPYVTSYEYADLHQLSSLWLGYVEDYRELRKGTIGSSHGNRELDIENDNLNSVGRQIVDELKERMGETQEVKSVVKYYLDIQQAVSICFRMVNDNGMVFFVVGDTEYKGVKVENSKHLIQCLKDNGFEDIKATRRTISNKLLTPYRDDNGKFSSDDSKRIVYHEEYIISGRKYEH